MYQALYRKWRPKTFDEVVGQDHITSTLKNEIIAGKPSHAFLLMGSRGTGKTTCAKLIAKAVNCEHPVNGNPCGECLCCRGIDNGSLVDVEEIDAASNNGVDNIRSLREEANFLPTMARYRVYIIDEAHMLSIGAVNALLKIMEEPPEHVIFILATTEVHKIPATIQSRCQRFDFKRINPSVIRDRLLYIADQEHFSLEDEAATLIARVADGGMRDALSLLDLCWANSGDVTVETVSEVAGLVEQGYLFQVVDKIIEGNFSEALSLIDSIADHAVEYDRLVTQLITHYRNLLVASTTKNPENLIICLPDTLVAYKEQSKKQTPSQWMDAIRTLQDTQVAMTKTASRKAELELGLIKLCDRRMSQSPEALLARIDELEAKLNRMMAEGIKMSNTTAMTDFSPDKANPDEKPQIAFAGVVQKNEKPSKEPPKPMDEEVWERILERLEGSNQLLRAALQDSKAWVRDQTVLVECSNSTFVDMMRSNDTTRASLKRAIAEVTGVHYGVGPYSGPSEKDVPRTDENEQKSSSPIDDLLMKASQNGIEVTRE